MIYTWNINPVVISLFGLDVRWYGLVYVLGFFFGMFLMKRLFANINLKIEEKVFENLAFGTFFVGVLGGRLGEFLFYSPQTFWENPAEIFKIWHGGMSIHGGILFAIIFLIFFCRKHKLPLLTVLDVLAIPVTIVLAFGRIANFINGELVGKPTDQTWGVIFPHVDNLLRHPSQIYESGRNFLLAAILLTLFKKEYWKKPGIIFSLAFIFYGILRFAVDYFRTPDGMIWIFSTGQFLCLLMVISGGILLKKQLKESR